MESRVWCAALNAAAKMVRIKKTKIPVRCEVLLIRVMILSPLRFSCRIIAGLLVKAGRKSLRRCGNRRRREMRSSCFRNKCSHPSRRPVSILDSWEKGSHLKGGARITSGTTTWERGQLLLEGRWIQTRKTVTPKREVDLHLLSVENAGCRIRHIGKCRVQVEPRVVAYGQIATEINSTPDVRYGAASVLQRSIHGRVVEVRRRARCVSAKLRVIINGPPERYDMAGS